MIFVVLYNEPRTLLLQLSYIPSPSLIYIFTLRQGLTKLNVYVAQAGLRLVHVHACVSECMSLTHGFYFDVPYTCRSLQRPEEEASNLLELKLQVVVSSLRDARNQTWAL